MRERIVRKGARGALEMLGGFRPLSLLAEEEPLEVVEETGGQRAGLQAICGASPDPTARGGPLPEGWG